MAKTKTKKKPKGGLAGRYSSQVEAESTLRFNPERSTIQQQIRDIEAERDTSVRAARGAAEGIKAAAGKAEPGIRKAYGEAGALLAGATNTTREDVAKLGPVADRFKASIARDRERAVGRLGESLAGATTELKQRTFDAEAGRVHAEGSARERATAAKSKLGERLRNIDVEEGAFRQGRAGELSEKQADRDFEADQNARDRSTRRATAGVDASGKIIKGGPKDKKTAGKGARLSPDQHADARSKIGRVRGAVKAMVNSPRGLSYDAIVQAVAGGAPARKQSGTQVDEAKYDELRKKNPGMSESEAKRKASYPVDANGNRLAAPQGAAPGFEGVGETVLARAIVDVERDGYVSRRTARMLHEAGYSVKGLGLPSYGGTPKAKRGEGARRRQQAGRTNGAARRAARSIFR